VFPWVISPDLSNGDRMCSARRKIDVSVILLRENSGLIALTAKRTYTLVKETIMF
jgi:hypothetical protein